jgi:hypothetical protein
MIDTIGSPVNHGSIRPQGRPTAPDGIQNIAVSDHVEKRVLLADAFNEMSARCFPRGAS